MIGSSCDEAYLDVTNGLKLEGVKEVGIESENASIIRGKAMAKFIQKHVTEKCKLNCSAGWAEQVGREMCDVKVRETKRHERYPFYYVSKEKCRDFMAKLPVQDVPG